MRCRGLGREGLVVGSKLKSPLLIPIILSLECAFESTIVHADCLPTIARQEHPLNGTWESDGKQNAALSCQHLRTLKHNFVSDFEQISNL